MGYRFLRAELAVLSDLSSFKQLSCSEHQGLSNDKRTELDFYLPVQCICWMKPIESLTMSDQTPFVFCLLPCTAFLVSYHVMNPDKTASKYFASPWFIRLVSHWFSLGSTQNDTNVAMVFEISASPPHGNMLFQMCWRRRSTLNLCVQCRSQPDKQINEST